MTKLEALEEMKKGKKVSHMYFTSDEYLYDIKGIQQVIDQISEFDKNLEIDEDDLI